MNFAYFDYLSAEYQADEIKVIGKTVKVQGEVFHIAAMLRRGTALRLYSLAQMDSEKERPRRHASMRSQLKDQPEETGLLHMEQLILNDLVLDISGSTGYGMAASEDALAAVFKLREAGWRMPKDSPFYETDWENLMLYCHEFQNQMEKIPDFENARLTAAYAGKIREYFVEKRVRLVLEAETENVRREKIVPFVFTDADGTRQEGICYISRLFLIDVWKELEERFASPQFQERMLEHQKPEEAADMKEQLMKGLAAECPRGMCYIGMEYECTLDVSLKFYTSEYLKSRPVAGEGCTVFFMMAPKPEKELGAHGLRLKAGVIDTPVPADTKEIRAELFSAQVNVPGWEEQLQEVAFK